MTDFGELPSDWVVWSDEAEGRSVLAYRPDVFDAEAFPAECLPTLYVSRGRRNARRPGVDPRDAASGDWYVTLTLEPEVQASQERYESRAAAVEGAVALARAFAAGEVDYREVYQVPRETYFEELDELTGREP